MRFRDALKNALDAQANRLNPHDVARIRHFLESHDSRRKDSILKRMEKQSREQLEAEGFMLHGADRDWGDVDWAVIILTVIRVVLLLLPLFFGDE